MVKCQWKQNKKLHPKENFQPTDHKELIINTKLKTPSQILSQQGQPGLTIKSLWKDFYKYDCTILKSLFPTFSPTDLQLKLHWRTEI